MELQLLILGLLYKKDLHPYEVLQILKQRQVHDYIKVNYGTLYYAFDQMEKKEMIEVKEIIQEERRPEKKIYRITDKGRKELQVLLNKVLRSEAKLFHPLYPALLNAHLADQDQLAEVIKKRLQSTQKKVNCLRELYEIKKSDHPFSIVMLIKNALMHSEVELSWLKEYLHGLENNRRSN